MTVTAYDVAQKLARHFQYEYSEPWSALRYEIDSNTAVDDLTVTRVAEGGGMDKGSAAFVVIRVVDANGDEQHFRKDGYYASYDGFTWDGDFYEVTPKEKTVTVYEDSTGVRVTAYDDLGVDSYDSYDDSYGC